MGTSMARRLLDAGVPLTVWNRNPARSRALARFGARVAASPAEASAGSAAVITMLATPAAVHDVVFGRDGIASASPEVLIQMSTIGVDDVSAIRARLPSRVELLDAPVLGSTPQAANGTLRLLVGGGATVVARWRPLLKLLGDPVHVGPIPSGSALKHVVNAAVAPMVALLAEALALGDRLGLDEGMVFDELARSRIGSLVHRKRSKIESGSYLADARLATFRKDMSLVEQMGRAHGLTMSTASAARRIADEAIEGGLAHLDYSAVVAHVRGRGVRGGGPDDCGETAGCA
jgi:3-hydroxyisobutyrate dehydrogenase-like beta-hydroxyacid dehydrogenase